VIIDESDGTLDAFPQARRLGYTGVSSKTCKGFYKSIVNAARWLASKAAAGEVDPEAIDQELFASALETQGIPDPDLLIRTSGEQRISNFLLWQLAYGEMVFTDRLWPDFTREDFSAAIAEYLQRERRYGAAISSG